MNGTIYVLSAAEHDGGPEQPVEQFFGAYLALEAAQTAAASEFGPNTVDWSAFEPQPDDLPYHVVPRDGRAWVAYIDRGDGVTCYLIIREFRVVVQPQNG